MLTHSVLCYLSYETIFYWVHRIMHMPAFYHLHEMHHRTRGSVGISGMYQGAIDYVLTTSIAHITMPYLLDAHCMTLWASCLVGSLNSVHSHSGWDFPLYLFPSPEEHNLHHWRYTVNFGTGPWDAGLQTSSSPTPADKEKLLRVAASLKKSVTVNAKAAIS